MTAASARGSATTSRLGSGLLGLAASAGTLGVLVLIDAALGEESAAIVGSYVITPFIAAFIAGPWVAALAGLLAVCAAALSPVWNMNAPEDADYVARLVVIIIGSGFAVASAWIRERGRSRSDRLGLLNEVGSVADGSLPLGETLDRVVGVVVPAVGDLCMIDAVNDGRVTRLAVRARGREDALAVEERIRSRSPSLPAWIVRGDRPWRQIPRWMPRMNNEDLRRMAHSPEDLEFLRSLDISSTITVPVMARDRNLGALTLVAAWSGRRYDADDLRFARILASRVGLALDNAGLFSDLESVERRMDSVMSILDEAVVIHGTDGELVFANPAAARTLGFETSEQAVSTPTDQIGARYSVRDESGRELGAEALSGRQAHEGGMTSPRTLRVVDRDTGRERWTRTKSRAIEGAHGEVLYSVTAIEDVTDVKRAEFAQRLLARAGELTAHADDLGRMLQEVPQMLAPEFADWCAVSMPRDDGTIEVVSLAHQDAERTEEGRRLTRRYPSRVGDGSPSAEVLETGRGRLVDPREIDAMRAGSGGDARARMLEDFGIGSAIIVPMSAGARVVGLLAFVNEADSRAFASEDLELAEEIGRRCGVAIEGARIADERARIAEALQRELLPPSLPVMPGWEMATMYEPAGELNDVGGDFYEVFRVDGGWAVVLGDVSGRGAAAASLTAEARHTIRAAGALSADPRAGLRILDQNLRERDDAALCSVAILVLPDDPDREDLVVYLAGHPQPLVIREDGVEGVGSHGPMLGIVPDAHWDAERVRIERGEQIVLYTDGVIEARGQSGERFGTDRLQRRLNGCRTTEATVERVRGALAAFGADARQDDAAVVAIRYAGLPASLPPAADGSRTSVTR